MALLAACVFMYFFPSRSIPDLPKTCALQAMHPANAFTFCLAPCRPLNPAVQRRKHSPTGRPHPTAITIGLVKTLAGGGARTNCRA
jgi:hypothetical protein